MVFGPILDAIAANKRGDVNVVQVISEGNRLVATRIPLSGKIVFWLTNVPYWLLSAELLLSAEPPTVAAGYPRSATNPGLAASMHVANLVFDPRVVRRVR